MGEPVQELLKRLAERVQDPDADDVEAIAHQLIFETCSPQPSEDGGMKLFIGDVQVSYGRSRPLPQQLGVELALQLREKQGSPPLRQSA